MRQFFSILFLAFSLASAAQQGLVMDFGEIDSTEMESHRQIEYNAFVNGTFGKDLLIQEFKLPEFSLSQNSLPSYVIGFDAFSPSMYMGGRYAALGGFSSNFHNAEVLSQAAYTLGNKLTVGGFSYGANSIMNAPTQNQQGSYFDTYGSTMFMQYKVSKNVSIETSISVGQNRGRAPGF